MAMACLRLVTFLPELPLRNVPRFRSRITFATFRDADLLYFLLLAMIRLRSPLAAWQLRPCRAVAHAVLLARLARLVQLALAA